jgi:hypothetical protein
VNVPPLIVNERKTVRVPDVDVKLPPVIWNGPLTSIAAALPVKVPPLIVRPVVPTVSVTPVFCVIVPPYPFSTVIAVTEKLLFSAAFPSQSASKTTSSPEPGAVAFPFALQSVPLAGADARQFEPTLVFPPEPIQ